MCSVSTFASAPGKLILFGEHAVVYGHPALAGALSDLRVPCRVRVLPTSGAVTLRLPGVASGGASGGGGAPLEFSWPLAALRASLCAELPPPGGAPAPPAAALRAALAALVVGVAEKEGHRRALLPALFLCAGIFSAHLGEGAAMPIGGLVAEVLPPSLPVGAGLGSSAAVCTALSAALLDAEARFCGAAGGSGCGSAAAPPPRAQLERINAWAFAAEALFHGTPSGLDNTVSTCVRRAQGRAPLPFLCPCFYKPHTRTHPTPPNPGLAARWCTRAAWAAARPHSARLRRRPSCGCWL
jgi:mevalonate kinase